MKAPFETAIADCLPAIQRAARAYERDPVQRADLVQDVLAAMWRGWPQFRGDASPRTWALRIAHNLGVAHVARSTRGPIPAGEALEDIGGFDDLESTTDRRHRVARVLDLVDRLKPVDRQVITLWLEGVEASEIVAITGLSATNVSTKVHRIRLLLADDRRVAR